MHNRWGLHWSNVHIDNRLGKLALGMGGDCYLVIDGGYGWIPGIKEARPNAIIVNRHAVSNWMDMEPDEWANQMADLFHQHKQYTKHIELECEPDIFPNFPGWGQPIIDRLKFAADWNGAVAECLRKLCPGVIIHSPPLAHERIDLPQWFEIWKPLLDQCDVLDMHCYWEKDGKYYPEGLYDPQESYHRAFRYRKIHDFLAEQNYHIPMMITECGNFAPNISGYADELIYYFSELEKDADYVIGGCVFILKSNKPNWVNDLTRQGDIAGFFNHIGLAPKKDLPYLGKEKPMEQPIRVLVGVSEVQVMELEEYLKGVLPKEMGPGAPREALRAQAVAARCYAMNAIKSPRHAPNADICITTHCQVWAEGQWPTTSQAIEDTGGIVATHNGEIINAFYFGHCDGRTRNCEDVWIQALPYCRSVDCPCGWDKMYGHGVGMCQQGAMKMASQGATFKEILWHYYTGTAIDGQTAPPPEPDSLQQALDELDCLREDLNSIKRDAENIIRKISGAQMRREKAEEKILEHE